MLCGRCLGDLRIRLTSWLSGLTRKPVPGRRRLGRRRYATIALAPELLEDRTLLSRCVNDPPVNSVPGSQETFINTPLAFTDYRENLISISDPDAGNLEVDMTLSSTNGVVTLVNRNLVSSGLTYLSGDGLEDTTVTVRGKITEINTALSWVAFTLTAGYTGTAGRITVTTNDLGNVGDGGPQEDTDTIDITVKALGDHFDDPPDWPTLNRGRGPGHQPNCQTPAGHWK